MSIKRSGLINIVWSVAMVIMIIMATIYATNFFDLYFAGDLVLPSFMNGIALYAVCGLAFIIAIILIYLIGVFIGSICKKHIRIGNNAKKAWQMLFLVTIVALALFHRIQYLTPMGDLTALDPGAVLRNTTVFDTARVTGDGIPAAFIGNIHGLTYVYTLLLSITMLLLGNNLLAVAVLQVLIQLISVALIYGIGRRYFGLLTGVCAAIVLTLYTPYVSKITNTDQGCLLVLFFLLGFYLISIFHTMENYIGKIIYGIITGLVLGMFFYLDAVLGVLLIIWFMSFFYESYHFGESIRDNLSDDEMSPTWPYICMFLTVLAGLLLVVLVDSIMGGVAFADQIKIWFFHNISAPLPYQTKLARDFFGEIENLLIMGFATMTTIGYFRKQECDTYGIWVLMLVIAITPYTFSGYLQDNSCAIAIYALLVGIGIRDMFTAPKGNAHDLAMDAAFEYIEAIEDAAILDNIEPTDSVHDAIVFADATDPIEYTEETEIEDIVSEVVDDTDAQATEETIEDTTEDTVEELDNTEDTVEEPDNTEDTAEELDNTEESLEELDNAEDTVEVPDNVEESVEKVENEYIPQVDEKPGMIPNPLPLPARRRHVQIEFGRDIPDSLMHFDIETTESDDFDV